MTVFNVAATLKPQSSCEPEDFTSDVYWTVYDGSASYDAVNGWWEIDFPVGGSGYMRLQSGYSWSSEFTPHTMIIDIEFDGIDTSTYPSEWVYFTNSDPEDSTVFANFATDFSNPLSVDISSLDGKPYRIRHTWDFGTPSTGSLRIRSIKFDSCP